MIFDKENDIDELFQDGLDREYPYDPRLWNNLEKRMDSDSRGRKTWLWNFNSIALFAVAVCCSFIQSDDAPNVVADNLNEIVDEFDYYAIANNQKIVLPQETNLIKQEVNSAKFSPDRISNNQSKEQISTKESNSMNESSTIGSNSFETGIQHVNSIKSSPLYDYGERKKIEILERLINRPYNEQEYIYAKSPIVDQEETRLQLLQNKLRKKHFYVEFSAEHAFDVNKQVSGLDQKVQDFKNDHERSLSKESYGLEILSHHRFLRFGFGIRFSKYTERANYAISSEETGYTLSHDTSYTLVNGQYDENGFPVLLIQENVETTKTPTSYTTTETIVSRNEFRRIQIPLSVGVEKSFGRILASIQTGVLVNYAYEQEGLYINEKLDKAVDFENQDQFNSLFFSQMNSAQLGYAINEFIVVGARYSYEYDINSFTKNYDSKLQSQNVGIWLRWNPTKNIIR